MDTSRAHVQPVLFSAQLKVYSRVNYLVFHHFHGYIHLQISILKIFILKCQSLKMYPQSTLFKLRQSPNFIFLITLWYHNYCTQGFAVPS